MTQYKKYIKINNKNAYELLKEFAKEYKRQLGKEPIEIIIVGGGSIMLNYSFREMTQDFDVYYPISADIKGVIYSVSDKLSLDPNWMNCDFVNTDSYSPKLVQYSKHYCFFNNKTIEFRTINDEYLIAMKMISMRLYRNDYSDIVGILKENADNKTPISYEQIMKALTNLYTSDRINNIDNQICKKIEDLCKLSAKELNTIYQKEITKESYVYDELLKINNKYDGVVTSTNVKDISNTILSKEEDNTNEAIETKDDGMEL